MNSKDIMAVVISFNGGLKTQETVDRLKGEVGLVQIIDNGSNTDSLAILDRYENHPGVRLMRLGENKGIGYALNIAVNIAHQKSYGWLLTMDQDSLVGVGMIDAFITEIKRNPSLTCLAANYNDSFTESDEEVRLVDYAITSGNLVKLDIYDRVGLYDEALFIDGVDFDFSLRLLNQGLKTWMVKDAHMHHELGEKDCKLPILGQFHTYHTPLRRYYMYRNYIYLMRQYARSYPLFFLKFTLVHILYVFTIAILGRSRLKSLAFICRGFSDAFRGKKGQYERS